MPAFNSIAPDKLVRLIGTPGAPALIDIREAAGSHLIPGSIGRLASRVGAWSPSLRGKPAIVVDEHGGPPAQGLAAWLRSDGVDAEILQGGMAAWIGANLPVLSAERLPARGSDGRTLWVTRARPKVDRIACPWLIRRFIDPDARFLFVPPADVVAVAADLGGEPFDVEAEGAVWSHRGDRCTFDNMVEAFGLDSIAALARLALIVRGADTDRLDIVPEAAGLLAISLGLSRMFADDIGQLEAGMLVYDALYRWCRDGQAETHNWASHAPARPRVSA